ncbi:NAD(P)-binding protein [Pluteus cervinus]|uniref:NAD(P)-binding protein n=1 Tax=Pluteus cervinus TaxID=181527 RepID=A0ACD3ALM8_9AGAR|nr:NAD(P)-binding protein [Pluteus cervinus]
MSKGLILVTGANGYIGGHIVDILLNEGWTVRALSRTGRAQSIRKSFPAAGERLQTVEVPDISAGDLSEAVKGVDAIIHTVSPGLSDSTPEDMIEKNVDGTLNIFKAGIAAGVKKLLYTSSFITLFNDAPHSLTSLYLAADLARALSDDDLITNTDWSDITLEQIDIKNTPLFTAYAHSKTIAEKEFWKLADQHPDIDFISFLPSMVLGPRIPTAPLPSNREGLSTIEFLYQLFDSKTYPPIAIGNYVHVRDVAKAHVAGLSINKSLPVIHNHQQKKRFILTAPQTLTWREAASIIRRERPSLDCRLPKEDAEGAIPQTKAPFDTKLTGDVLGLREWKGLEETLLETVDWIVEWEKAKGLGSGGKGRN